MVMGGNSDNKTARKIRQRQIADDGRCTFCAPHRGENQSRERNNRYVDGRLVNRKPKESK